MKKTWMGFLLCMLIGLFGCGGNSAKTIDTKNAVKPYDTARFIVAGSGTNLPVTVKLAEAYTKKYGYPVEIPPSIGTDGATIALESGALELGLISRPLTQKEIDSGLRAIPYAKVGIVFATPKAVTDENLTPDDLLKIHQGTKTTWSNGKTIFVIIREKHDSSNQVLYKLIPGWQSEIARSIEQKRWQVAYKDAEVMPLLLSTPWSIALSDSTDVMKHKMSVKALAINGVSPEANNIVNGTYPYSKDLLFAYKGTLTERSKHFVEYAKSAEGKAIISEIGAVPVSE